jgi:hypothetical protein
MEVAEHDAHREEHDVAWVPSEEAYKFDHLGEAKHEDKLSPEGISPVLQFPVTRRPPATQEQQRVNEKGERREGGEMNGVGTPFLLAAERVSFSSSNEMRAVSS